MAACRESLLYSTFIHSCKSGSQVIIGMINFIYGYEYSNLIGLNEATPIIAIYPKTAVLVLATPVLYKLGDFLIRFPPHNATCQIHNNACSAIFTFFSNLKLINAVWCNIYVSVTYFISVNQI